MLPGSFSTLKKNVCSLPPRNTSGSVCRSFFGSWRARSSILDASSDGSSLNYECEESIDLVMTFVMFFFAFCTMAMPWILEMSSRLSDLDGGRSSSLSPCRPRAMWFRNRSISLWDRPLIGDFERSSLKERVVYPTAIDLFIALFSKNFNDN